jgi:transposase
VLQTLSGANLIGAAMLLVEIGADMDAFGSAGRLASWVSIYPCKNESAGKHKSGRVRKSSLHVRRLLCQVAHAASRTTSVLKSKFQGLIVRRGDKRSIVVLAHTLLDTISFMLRQPQHYRDCATDYEALSVQRNASRWIKGLTRFGFIPAVT